MLHTTFIRVRAPLWPNVFQNKNELNRRNVCGLAVKVVSQAYSGYAEIMARYVLAFLYLRQPSPLLHLGEGLWVEWCSSVATSVKAGNRKSGGIIHCFFLVKSCQLEVRGFDIKTEF